MSKEQIKELAEDNAIYEFNKFKKIYGNCTDEYIRHFCNKLAELKSRTDDNHTCNCKHNNNSKDNEPCCRCDSRQTNADRIRNMSDEELADWINTKNSCDQCTYEPKSVCMKEPCVNGILKWLQSEVV